MTYRSEPPLPTSDIIGLLAFGQTSEESAQLNQSQSAFNSETSNAILSAALNATVSNRVQKLFGVSRIKIDPQGFTTETSSTQSGPAVTIEQQVKNNLTLTYTTNVAGASQQSSRWSTTLRATFQSWRCGTRTVWSASTCGCASGRSRVAWFGGGWLFGWCGRGRLAREFQAWTDTCVVC